MNLVQFLALILASGAIIEVWHKGSIFDEWRARSEAAAMVTSNATLKGKFLELLTCHFCQSYHVPIYLGAAYLLCQHAGGLLSGAATVILFGLAATRAGNILNGLLPKNLKYTTDIFDED
jgi:hypothetical protein